MLPTVLLNLVLAASLIQPSYQDLLDEFRLCNNTRQLNPDEELKFVRSPLPGGRNRDDSPYPAKYIATFADQYTILQCCGMGFNKVNWYFRGQLISRDDPNYRYEENGQALHWYKPPVLNEEIITCELVKNESETLRHDIKLRLLERPAPPVGEPCAILKPYFTLRPQDTCASPGDSPVITCEAHYGDDKCTSPLFKKVYFGDEAGHKVFTRAQGYENTEYSYAQSDTMATEVNATLIFHNITKEQLSRTYYCYPGGHEYLKSEFKFTGSCSKENDKTTISRQFFDGEIATWVSVVMVVIPVVVICVAVLLCVYKVELGIIWNTYIQPMDKGSYSYDGYMLCSKDDKDLQFMVSDLLPQIEDFYKLCVPDRDFPLGSVIPQKLSEYIQSSKRLIVIASSHLLKTDYSDLAFKLAITYKIPIIFIKRIATDQEDEDFKQLLDEKNEISAALSVSTDLLYPASSDEKKVKSFYDSVYEAMPLAKCQKTIERQKSFEEVL